MNNYLNINSHKNKKWYQLSLKTIKKYYLGNTAKFCLTSIKLTNDLVNNL